MSLFHGVVVLFWDGTTRLQRANGHNHFVMKGGTGGLSRGMGEAGCSITAGSRGTEGVRRKFLGKFH